MKAILLAAGLGTRLRPITDTVPKCMVPVGGRPLLEYWLGMLFGQGVSEVLINTHYLPQQVQDYVDASPWRDQVTLVHETVLRGTGGTVLDNRDFFGQEPVIVAHADNLAFFDVRDFFSVHLTERERVAMTMMTFHTDRPETCGIVEMDDEGMVCAFHEKVDNPPGDQANGAVYVFNPEVPDFMQSLSQGEIDISLDVIPSFLGRIRPYNKGLYLRDIGSPESLKRAEQDITILRDALSVPNGDGQCA